MLRVTARAKINWTLDILGIRPDSYHLLDMLLQSVELCDTLWLEKQERLTLRVEYEEMGKTVPYGEDAGLKGNLPTQSFIVTADEKNLVMKAARALQEATGSREGAMIRLVKRIPVGAGMGGGSADAAAALLGLCELWGLTLPREKLQAIALSLGADVPFMLTGGLVRVQGIGEMLRPLSALQPLWLVIIQPCQGLSTKEIFDAYDQVHVNSAPQLHTQAAQETLLCGDLQRLAKTMGNALEPVSTTYRPEIGQAIRALEDEGAIKAMMTGSGSAVFGLFGEEESARHAYERLQGRWRKTYLTKTAKNGITWMRC
ncbi:MAG: 4-(cytidine 5'-diphospho)-2-C-methyl-D-erythritol kinase [Clostridiales bacterium]|nr:4-(cytidine 5'-diphospho)-2-C-methyl-D-erythritol kinase [Clostridiales bacterium]